MRALPTTRSLGAALTATILLALAWGGPAAAGETAAVTPDRGRTALLITDPQNDFMAETGAAWGLVKDNVLRLETRENIERLMKAAKNSDLPVFVSPHFYYPHDQSWQARGTIQHALAEIGMFQVAGSTDYQGFEGSGADFYAPLKKYILDGETVIASPHKVYGPDSSDLALQLRKRGIDTVIVGGFAANLCTDSHMRELIEQGFQVIMVEDAVGAPGEEAYQAALLNYGMIANAVWSTETVEAFLK